ncbi:MAG: AbrB/MazE/SpoVT family DNA-binding domain-containing protein [Chloroflexi bacterium]|nr:AbrB/MazE/SpoVT family DNA-binding domain-containing protein [Chloroflexota bacterium]
MVIPSEFRKRHKIKKGDHLRLIDCGDFIAIVPPPESLPAEGLSKLPHGYSATDDLLESRAADTWREERNLPPPRRE